MNENACGMNFVSFKVCHDDWCIRDMQTERNTLEIALALEAYLRKSIAAVRSCAVSCTINVLFLSLFCMKEQLFFFYSKLTFTLNSNLL